MMRKSRPDYRPTCYCIGFDPKAGIEGSPPDLPYAQRVADHLDVDLRTITVNADMIQHLEKMIYYLDEPQADPAPIHVMLIAEQARKDGIKVLLSGTGGDDIFSGYRRHQALVAEPYWSWLPLALRRFLANYARKNNGDATLARWLGGRNLSRRLKKVMLHADLPEEERLMGYFFWSEETLRTSLYAYEIRSEILKTDVTEPLRDSLRHIPNEKNDLNRMLYLEAKHFLADHNLNYTDKASMAFGVEVRVPLIDIGLINLAARIPPSMKQKGRVGKAIFKKAMVPYLPKDVIYRPKTGFGVPLRRWLHNELRELVSDVLSSKSLKNRGLFEPNAVQRLLEHDRSGHLDGAYVIFALVCIELWCRIFLDNQFSLN
jgi:asparagine synthase (glutamine-hydrolysing)